MTESRLATSKEPGCGRRVLVWPALLVFGSWMLGQILRDRFVVSQLLFYLPSPLVAALLVATAVPLFVGHRRTGLLLVLLAMAPVASTLVLENQWPSRTPQSGGRVYRLLHWNINGYHSLRGEHLEQLERSRADLFLFSEAGRSDLTEALTESLGDGWSSQSIEPMFVIDEESVWGDEVLIFNHWMRVRLARWKTDETTLLLMFVDLISDPEIHRDPLLRAIDLLIDKYRPDIVIGDFNAPRRSRALADLPPGYRNAYDAAGSGWSYSYSPLPLLPPLFAIDQCIIGPRIDPVDYRLPPFRGSDHRPQILDFRIRTDEPER